MDTVMLEGVSSGSAMDTHCVNVGFCSQNVTVEAKDTVVIEGGTNGDAMGTHCVNVYSCTDNCIVEGNDTVLFEGGRNGDATDRHCVTVENGTVEGKDKVVIEGEADAAAMDTHCVNVDSCSENVVVEGKEEKISPDVGMGIGSKRKVPLCSDVSTQTHNSLHTEGNENVTCAGTDVVRSVNQFKRLNVEKGDIQAFNDYFCRMQLISPNFFYVMDFNDQGCLGSVFWADGRSRAAHGQFGDVVVFDTTYLLHKYKVPLFVFVGVNHHGQSVLLGCGMLADETKESYCWLFKAWLTCMSGRPPYIVITDQCNALRSAASEVFPKACHCLCLSNIMHEISEKLRQVNEIYEYRHVIDELNQAVYNSLRIDEFELAWENIVQRYKIQHHKWLQELYQDRIHWVPVYLKEISFLGILTIRQNESRIPFFEGYIYKYTSLKDFFVQYELALQHKYEEEAKATFESGNLDVLVKTKCCFERQLSKVYTRDIFRKFQNEVEEMYCCFNTTQVNVDGGVVTYIVKERVDVEGTNRVIREYEVLYDTLKVDVRCICGWFYFKGYLCRHAMSVLNHNGIEEIPSQYILSRWRKDVKRMFVSDHGSIYVNADSPLHRYDQLHRCVSQIVEEGMISQEHYKDAMRALEGSLDKIRHVEHLEPHITIVDSNLSEDDNITDLNQMASTVHLKQATVPSLERMDRISEKMVTGENGNSKETDGTGVLTQQFPPYLEHQDIHEARMPEMVRRVQPSLTKKSSQSSNDVNKEEEPTCDTNVLMGTRVDLTKYFTTDQVFGTTDEVRDWVRIVGPKHGTVVYTKRSDKAKGRRAPRLEFACVRGRKFKETQSISIRSTASKKCECPFTLRCVFHKDGPNSWKTKLVVDCGVHNHLVDKTMEGHVSLKKLGEAEKKIVHDMTRVGVKPREVMNFLKERDPETTISLQQIYNARYQASFVERDN